MASSAVVSVCFIVCACVTSLCAQSPSDGPSVQQAYIKASNPDPIDQFGSATAVSGDTAVVGAELEASNGVGVNGNQADDSLEAAGAAYVFVRNGSSWSQQAYLKSSNTDAGQLFARAVAIDGDTIAVGAPGESSVGVANGAVYIFVRSGTTWTQQALLMASNAEGPDNFGNSVALEGDTLVVGAPWEGSGDTGVNGNQADNSAPKAGAAYVFVRSGTSWAQQAYLKASNTGADDEFGVCVSLSGETLAVSAQKEDSNALGVNGNQASNVATDSGAAYVFVRSGTTWTQQAYLKASNTGVQDQFGGDISLSGATLVVGALFEDSFTSGINGSGANNAALEAGAAYVFVRTGTSWSQQAFLKASNVDTADRFGWSVTASGNRVVVGAPFESSNGTGLDPSQSNDLASTSGAVYVFGRNGTTWTQQSFVKSSNSETGDQFGSSLALAGDLLLAAAYREDGGVAGVGGNQADNSVDRAGAAYAFSLVPTNSAIHHVASGAAGTLTPGQSFNESRGADVTVLGSQTRHVSSMSLDGLFIAGSVPTSVRARIYDSTTAELLASGSTIVASGGLITIPLSLDLQPGASYRLTFFVATAPLGQASGVLFDPSPPGIAGFPYNEASGLLRVNSGWGISTDSFPTLSSTSVPKILLETSVGTWSDLGSGLAGVSGLPALAGTGDLISGTAGTLALSGSKPSAPCTLHVSVASTPVPFKGGTLVPFPILLNIPLVTTPSGTLFLPFAWPGGLPSGTSFWFQFSISDTAAIKKVALSNALKATTP